MGLTGLPPLSMSGSGLTSQVLKRRFPFLTHEQEGFTPRLKVEVEVRGGSFSKSVVPGLNLRKKIMFGQGFKTKSLRALVVTSRTANHLAKSGLSRLHILPMTKY